MSGVSVREAARRLGVNQARVRALLKQGELDGERIGSQWVLDEDSVARRSDLAPSTRGRPFSRKIAWSAAVLLDGRATPWLASSERSRLKTRLARHASSGADAYRWWMRKHASSSRYRVADGDIGELLGDESVVAGGISTTSAHDLGLSYAGEAEVYIGAADLARVVDDFFLVESERGNLVVHLEDSGEDWHLRTTHRAHGARSAPRLVVAVNLLNGRDTRSRSAGARLLTDLLSPTGSGKTDVV